MIVRKTGKRVGRNTEISPENSALQFLTYRRTRLEGATTKVEGESGKEELTLVALRGHTTVTVGGEAFELEPWDALYVPPGNRFEMTAGDHADIAEAAAPSTKKGKPTLVRFNDAHGDGGLTIHAGKPGYKRDVVKLIDQNVDAERLLCGFTLGKPGDWTSWAPHEHAAAREEIYLYVDMPEPSFGIQMVYEDLGKPELVEPVFEDDAVVITKGYHPNSGIPGFGIKFLWMMAAINPETDREWADMNDQPEFAGMY